MWPFASGALSEQPIAAASVTPLPTVPPVFPLVRLLLHVYPLSQVPQFIGAFITASLVAKVITDSGAASLHRRYPASLPPPSRSADFPVLPVIRPTFARRFLAGARRASPLLSASSHRAVATTWPECRSASASPVRHLLSSSEGGLSLPGFDVSGPPLRSLATARGEPSVFFPRRAWQAWTHQIIGAIQTTGLWLLPRRAYPPLNAPPLLGTSLIRFSWFLAPARCAAPQCCCASSWSPRSSRRTSSPRYNCLSSLSMIGVRLITNRYGSLQLSGRNTIDAISGLPLNQLFGRRSMVILRFRFSRRFAGARCAPLCLTRWAEMGSMRLPGAHARPSSHSRASWPR